MNDLSSTEPPRYRRFLRELLPQTRPLIVEPYGDTGELRFKRGREAITEVDARVEAWLRERILAEFPDHRVVGEEEGAAGARAAATEWHVDPIDGTLNYALQVPLFSCSVGVWQQDRGVAGAIYVPLQDEIFSAARGEGAFLGDTRLQVSDRDRVGEAIASNQSTRSGRFVRDPQILANLRRSFMKTRRLGSIALELAFVACGRFDALLASKGSPQNLYDVAAGILLVEEAGGRVTNGHGEPFREGDHELVASNGRIHHEILGLLGVAESEDEAR